MAKNFFDGYNRFRRLVALWLVFVMTFTPFFSNLCGEYVVKAASDDISYNLGEIKVDSEFKSKSVVLYSFKDSSINFSFSINNTTGSSIEYIVKTEASTPSASDRGITAGATAKNVSATVKYSDTTQYLMVYARASAAGDSSGDGGGNSGEEGGNSGEEGGNSGESSSSGNSDGGDSSGSGSGEEGEGNENSENGGGGENVVNNVDSEGTSAQDGYSLVYSATLISADVDYASYAAKQMPESNTYYNTKKTITYYDDSHKVYDVITSKDKTTYYYATLSWTPDSKTGVRCSKNEADGNSYTFDPPENGNISYNLTMGLTTESDSSEYKDLKKGTLKMTSDKKAPKVTVELYHFVDGTYTKDDGFSNDVSGVYQATDSASKYKITVTDNDGGVGIKSVTYNGKEITSSGDKTYEIDVSKWSEGAKLVATDKAGNKTEISLREVGVLATNLREISCSITTASGKEISLGSGTTYYNGSDALYLKVFVDTTYTTTDGNAESAEVTVRVDASGSGECSGAVLKKNLAGKYFYRYTYSLAIRNENVSKEIKNLSIKVKYGQADTEVTKTITTSLFCDSEAPENPTVKLQRSADGVEWTDYSGSYIDTSKSTDGRSYNYKYRYAISNVVDGSKNGTGSGLADSDFLQISKSKIWETSATSLTKGSDGIYYHEFTDAEMSAIDKLKEGESYTNYIKVRDRAGNQTTLSLALINKMDSSIMFGTLELRDSENNVRSLYQSTESSDETTVNGGYKLYVEVTSGYPLDKNTKPALGYMQDELNDASFKFDETESVLGEEKDDSGRYTSCLVFEIPAAAELASGDNKLYEELHISVYDEAGNLGDITLAKLLYDNSMPYVSVLDYPTDWVSLDNARLTYEIVSGSSSTAESKLASAGYSTDGGEIELIDTTDKNKVSGTISVPESKTTAGTQIVFSAIDSAGNALTSLNGTKPNEATVKVDNTAPTITALTAGGKSSVTAAIGGNPVMSVVVSDNLTLARIAATVTYPDGTTSTLAKTYSADEGLGVNIKDSYEFSIGNSDGRVVDGDYSVSVVVYDKAGNASEAKTMSFAVDNTAPVVTAAIAGGTKGGKQARADGTDYYYSSDVPIAISVEDDNFTTASVTVTDKVGSGSAQKVNVSWTRSGNKYIATYTASGEGRHVITVDAVDPAGNQAAAKSVEFVIDKTAPTLSFSLNGLVYTESRGLVYLTTDAQLTASISDLTEDASDLNIQIIKSTPGEASSIPSYVKTGSQSFSFSEEAEYTVNIYARDMAGNRSAVRTVTFRVDKTAPELTISGAAGNGTSANATTVTFSMKEVFWQDATGQVNIYKKAGDGKEETLYKTIQLTSSAYSTSVSESLMETGLYRFEFTAADKAGHTSETSQTFVIDRDAPVVTLSGVNNYDITDKSVQFSSEITDDFYSSKRVSLSGFVTDIDGNKKSIDFDSFNQSGNPTVISQEFSADGVYDIEVTSSDAAGNSHSSRVHFTIDKTDPEIADLSAYDGTILREFIWDYDLDDLVYDLTVCDTHVYLNGSEFDGETNIEDGSYTLLVTAEDELGHYVERSVSFVLDTKAPVFIVTGVEDGQVKNEEYNIDVSLQLSEDTLKEVSLNGSAVELTDNTASIRVNEKGDYTLTMMAVDEAGNEAMQQISFSYGEEKSNRWILLVVILGLIAIGAAVVVTVRKNGKEKL